METLANVELMSVCGGSRALWLIIGGGILLIVGIIDGIINPQKCNNSK